MRKCFLLLSASAAALALPAHAQEEPAAAPQDSVAENYDPNAIIVTATRRASPLSDVPIAVSAVTSELMRNSGASDIRQLNQLAPSLLVSSTGSEANGSARIRGIGTVGDNPGLESSVGVFIDGVYRSRTGAGLNELGEIERVEVLRGPQGTLFGRNTSAGLLNIVSKAPSFQFGGSGEITYGNYDYWRLSGRVTGPVTDSLALSLDGVRVKRDGFLTNVDASGDKTGETNDRDRYFLRGQALFEPTDDLSIRIIGDYTNRDESCCGAVYIGTQEKTGSSSSDWTANPSNRIVTILQSLGAVYPNGSTPYNQDPYERNISITPGRDYVSKLDDWGLSAEINYDFGPAKLTSITAYRDYKSQDYGDYDYNTADILYRDEGTYRQFKTFTQELRLQGTAFEDKLDWLVGGYYAHEKLTLRDNIRFGEDYGSFAACRLMAGTGATSNLSSSQLAACGSSAGVNALISGTQSALNAALTPAVGATQAAAISGTLGNGLRSLSSIGDSGDVDSRYFQNSENWALFTHNIVHVTDRLDLTLGLRYTHERKKFSADLNNDNATCDALQATSLPALAANTALGSAARLAQGILTLGCLGNASTNLNTLDLEDEFSDGEFSGAAVLSYKPIDHMMVYASYSRGYKAGGYNLDRFQLGVTGTGSGVSPVPYFSPRTNADAETLRFDSETVDAFEIGLKYSRANWGVNIAAFRQEFTNFQLNTFNGTSFVVQNINGCAVDLETDGTCSDTKPGLVSQGVEIEMNASPIRDLRVTGGFTYTRAKFAKRLVGSSDGQRPLDTALFNLPGNYNSNAPKYVVTASLGWTPAIGTGGLSALFYVDGRMTSDYNTGSDLFPEKNQDGYTVVNARIGLRGPDERWALEFWGQNIFDTEYTQVAFNSPLQGSGPCNSTVAQLGTTCGGSAVGMVNQTYSAYLAEPRTYGVTLRGKF